MNQHMSSEHAYDSKKSFDRCKLSNFEDKIDKVTTNNVFNTSKNVQSNDTSNLPTKSLFDGDLWIDSNEDTDLPMVSVDLDKSNMAKFNLPDGKEFLTLFDTGANINLLSESCVNRSKYLSGLEQRQCEIFKIRNISCIPIKTDTFLEIQFKIKEGYMLRTTALVVPDFGNVDFILSTKTMEKLGSVIDLEEKKIKIRKKSFVFKSCNMIHLKPGSVAIINVKSNIPKPLKNHSFICKPFAPYLDMLFGEIQIKQW